jgi:hypothetical protein
MSQIGNSPNYNRPSDGNTMECINDTCYWFHDYTDIHPYVRTLNIDTLFINDTYARIPGYFDHMVMTSDKLDNIYKYIS